MHKMNSNDDSDSESFVIDNKPIITCAGDLALWGGLDGVLVQAIPQETCDWRRPLGRPTRSVRVGASFVPFSVSALPHEGNWDLIRQPILHIYWTECADTDAYKLNVRDDLEAWLKELNQKNIVDWMIVVVETYDVKRANKLLPRATVLDKIRADFAPKQGDRCLSVINPMRAEFSNAESWRGLVSRIRVLLLSAYSRALTQLEEHIREQREKRNQPSWDFCQYFLLQEELALVLEMLGLYDEALVQYDELDALFSQFIVNAHMGETADWLSRFQKSIEQWHQLVLGRPLTREQRSAVLGNGQAPLLEFRSYLYSRQAGMLILLSRPWEIAQRCLPFLHTTVRELSLLEISYPSGAINCWILLACLEVLQICNKFSESEQVEAYSLYTADILVYAMEKLRALGQLCGLFSSDKPTSEQLHIVVGLSAGMGDCPGTTDNQTPTDKLKEALCSKEAYNKHYLELAELAMGTYKHIGRKRSAKRIGIELASFYILQGQITIAIVFLTDALRMFEGEKWKDLVAQTHIELAACCYKNLDCERFIFACVAIASAPELELLVRNFYFDEMINTIKQLPKETKPLVTNFSDAFKIFNISIKGDSEIIMQDSIINVDIIVENNFPREVWCDRATLSIITVSGGNKIKLKSSCTYREMQAQARPACLRITIDRKQDGQIESANVACKVAEKEMRPIQDDQPNENVECIVLESLNISLKPGSNSIKFVWKAVSAGLHKLEKLILTVESIQFTLSELIPAIGFSVIRQEPVIRLDQVTSELTAGFEQCLQLIIKNGSFLIEKDSTVKLRGSKGLFLKQADNKVEETFSRDIILTLPQINPFETVTFELVVICELGSKKDEKPLEQKIEILCSWKNDEQVVPLHFTPLFKTSWRLHTAHVRKFIQVTVTGLTSHRVLLRDPQLECESITLKSLNLMKGQPLVVSNSLNVSFMWEMEIDDAEKTDPIEFEFNIHFTVLKDGHLLHEDGPVTKYQFNFDIQNYKTLFIVRSSVEPSKGNEFCRSGTMCQLRLSVSRVNITYEGSLMYEVLADQSMWAVCGRTAGVVALDSDEPQTVTLDVMPLSHGHMPLPLIRLSKYIPAENIITEKSRKIEMNIHPRLEPFSAGQVYNYSKAQQVHVIPAATESNII